MFVRVVIIVSMAVSVLRARLNHAGISGSRAFTGVSTGMDLSDSPRAGVVTRSEAWEEAGLETFPRNTGRGRIPGNFAACFFSLSARRLAELAADLSQ